MKSVLLILSITLSFNLLCQEDWKLPMVNGKIQFEFNSNQIETNKKDLCQTYFSTNTQTELMKKLSAIMTNGKVKFFSESKFLIIPQLFGADASISNMSSYMPKCKSNVDDTLIGSLTISLTQAKMFSVRSGQLKCLYRIILKDNTYNIKFRGFEYTYWAAGKLGQPAQKMVVNLEDQYTEDKPSKSDRGYWSDIKMIIGLFNSTLETTLQSQASELNFDDK